MEDIDYYKFIYSKQKIHRIRNKDDKREEILRWLRHKIRLYFSSKKEIEQREVFFSVILLLDNYIDKSDEQINHLNAITCLFLKLKMETMQATYDIDFFTHCIVGFMKHMSFREVMTEILNTEKTILSVMKFDLHRTATLTNFLHIYFKTNNEKNDEIRELTWYILEVSMYILPEIKPSLLVLSAYLLSQVKHKVYDSMLLEESKHNFSDVRETLKILMNMIKMDNKVCEQYKIPVKKYFK